jgi:short-subunit dehydrogenase
VSKYGVVALSEGLRNELGPRGIGVSVLPVSSAPTS